MKPVFENPSKLEKIVKENFLFPSFIMMENAASCLACEILKTWKSDLYNSVIFICGKGNNGADGFACARMLFSKIPVHIFCPTFPTTEEGKIQVEMAKRIGIPLLSKKNLFTKLSEPNIIVDCLYGTGFHGELSTEEKQIFSRCNDSRSFRIACDISSGFLFSAHKTITMGSLKSVLFSDKAKEVSGKIIVAELGISNSVFTSQQNTSCFLLESNDITLPYRKSINTHKGKYGHTAVISGEKAGASILAAQTALHFGTGFASLIETPLSDFKRFKISPDLMISNAIPTNTSSILIGSGLGKIIDSDFFDILLQTITEWFKTVQNPSCVIDADLFSCKKLIPFLKTLNSIKNARIILTPHAKELQNLVGLLNQDSENSFPEISSPAQALENRILIGKQFTHKFRNITLIMKGANTFIADKGNIYIFNDGSQALAKAGSGDVLAGMAAALLSQGYSGKDAAITAVFRHGTAGAESGKTAYNLTPQKLISLI